MIRCGDALTLLRELPDEHVQCVVTSPPYWGLRDYGVEGQLGLEPSPYAYVERMVEVFAEVRRVLRKDGTLWLNLGDSYASNPASGGPGQQDGGEHQRTPRRDYQRPYGLKPKDLVGIPWRLAFALQDAGWWLRSDIIWSKPNPMPESVTDRPTKAHEYLFLLAKSERYYYDGDAIAEPAVKSGLVYHTYGTAAKDRSDVSETNDRRTRIGLANWNKACPETRNIRSVWTISTTPYAEAHFATFPEDLVEPCIKAGTSEKGCCSRCGAPYRRERERVSTGKSYSTGKSEEKNRSGLVTAFSGYDDGSSSPVFRTTGWSPGCSCGADKAPCLVLDPFAGAGTVGVVCKRLDRRFLGLELNPAYVEMAERRVTRSPCYQEELGFAD